MRSKLSLLLEKKKKPTNIVNKKSLSISSVVGSVESFFSAAYLLSPAWIVQSMGLAGKRLTGVYFVYTDVKVMKKPDIVQYMI